MCVFFSTSKNIASQIELPDSFYDLSVADVGRDVESRLKKIEDSQLLIPWKRYKVVVI